MLFLQIQSINIVYPSKDKMIVVPIVNRIEIITSIQVCLILWMNINYKENGEKKTFLTIPKHQYRVPHNGEHDCNTKNKKNRDYYEYQSLSHLANEL